MAKSPRPSAPADPSQFRPLPPRANLEHLKNQAKKRLTELRGEDPQAKLADAQHAVAKSYGFSNWRALKAHVDFLHSPERERQVRAFFDAVRRRDLASVQAMADDDPSLVYADPPGGGPRPIMVAANAEHHGAEPGMVDLLERYKMPVRVWEAAAIGKTGIVATILEHHPEELDQADAGGMTPLLWAVHGRHLDTFAYLLSRGANPKVREATGWTPLHMAAERDDPRFVRGLLGAGADADAVLPSGEKAMHIAAKHGHAAVVDALRAAGQALDVWTAAAQGRIDELERMSEMLDAPLPGKARYRPIHFAAHAGQEATVDWLLAHDVDIDVMSALRLGRFDYVRERACDEAGWVDKPDAEGFTAMHLCAAHHMHDALRVLIEAGAAMNPVEPAWQATPLGWAEHHGDAEAAHILRDAGAKLATELRADGDAAADAGDDPLDAFGKALRTGRADRVRDLLQRFPVVRERINDPLYDFGRRPIHAAAAHKDVLDVLIDFGADINLRSDWSEGPFTVLDDCPEDVARHLLGRGATLTAHAAARLGWLDELRAIVRANPDVVHEKGGDGQRPLHFAKTPEIVDFLLDHDADIDARCVDHHSTPAQYALVERPDVCRRLLERGATPDIFMAAHRGDAALARQCIAETPDCLGAVIGAAGYDRAPAGTIYNWTLNHGLTPHQVAINAGHSELYAWLMDESPLRVRFLAACRAADAAAARAMLREQPDLVERLTPGELGVICDAAFAEDASAVRLMLELGFPTGAKGSWHGATPLHHAAWRGHLPIVELLLEHNPPLEQLDDDHKSTPLGWCCHGSRYCANPAGDYPAVARRLLEAGARIRFNVADATEPVAAVLRQYAEQD
ncbi:MAG: ankyrin repeat domain-containing protein [Phycisphaeraceae bacterium]